MRELTIQVSNDDAERLTRGDISPAVGDWLAKAAASLDASDEVLVALQGRNRAFYYRGELIGYANEYKRASGPYWQINLKTEGYRNSLRRKTLAALIDAAGEYMKGRANEPE